MLRYIIASKVKRAELVFATGNHSPPSVTMADTRSKVINNRPGFDRVLELLERAEDLSDMKRVGWGSTGFHGNELIIL
jgi:hypothetical protein